MNVDLVVSVTVTVFIVAIFWLSVVAWYLVSRGRTLRELLVAEPPEDIDWPRVIRLEIENFNDDQGQQLGPDGNLEYEQFGVAENITNENLDKENVDRGDMWLCDNRIFYFIALHLALAVVLSMLSVGVIASFMEVSLGFWWHLVIETGSVLLVAVVVGYFSYVWVSENERVAVKRFGEQLRGYFAPGLQFVLPLIEVWEAISLKRMVWGPSQPGENDTQSIGGIAGSVNPSPGKFKLLLARRWEVLIEVAVTMHLARNKNAWYTFLNTYGSTNEIGQQIAVVIAAILTRAVGEGTGTTSTTGVTTDRPEREGTGTTPTTGARTGRPEEDMSPESVMNRFNELSNSVPEICSNLLKGLLRIRGRLPMIIESVSLTGPIAEQELMQWLQIQDESAIKVLQQKRVGEASRQRFDQLLAYIKGLDGTLKGPALLEAFQHLNAQEVQRLFAEAGKNGGSIEALIQAFLAGKVEDLTNPKKPPRPSGNDTTQSSP